ncbi:decaprenylphospho-beta-D-erythro-pentofuranosid-2-ulose 2-reductase [Nonomuraea polychroma]|uniref:Decaprenylphospho-beta-D-erythro-pentofuranosid-2-ulose 2-reductase n=1 Tax=Nonomuraea polychroma TaxID=46176 RepID=A0A438MQ58_9ACTN|nr:SDR family NAD(P)-dependent oxidoreductase [Nonomuraea polychroma]RVX47575.1 decaprenylphospho-beta-D-erythro-pentofuranosid-2-ulose 2-reductase [Nonomuraea polychroma]
MKNALGAVDTVLLLGGRSEIGLEIVKLLVGLGASRVVLAARGDLAPPALSAEFHVLPFDALDVNGHGAVFDKAVELVGDLDVVISGFGVLGSQADYDADPAAAARDVAVNYGAHVSVGLHAARVLREQGHGTLVMLSSVAGARVRKSNFVYGSAKAGLDGFAQGLGDALHGSGARVLIVRPGFVIGRMTKGLTPAPLSSTPRQVASATVRALREGASSVWVPRALGPIFAVMRLLPRALWRRMPR